MKKTIIVAVLLISIIALCGCNAKQLNQPEQPTYKGLNGEVITDLGQYAIDRIVSAEGVEGGQVIELKTEVGNGLLIDRIFIVVFVDKVYVYEYAVNEYGTVDDTWAEQNLKW